MCYQRSYMKHRGWYGAHQGRSKHKDWQQRVQSKWNYPPVNIQELEDRFELNVYVSGFTKEDIQIRVTNNYLWITGSKPEDNIDQNWKRQEFFRTSFERKFELSEKVDQQGISAKFEASVLVVTLKKLPGFETVEQEINIA